MESETANAPEVEPAEAPNYDDMSMEDIEAAFARGEGTIREEPPEEPEEQGVVEEPAAEESTETPEPQAADEAVAEATTEAPAEESPEEPEILDDNALQMQEMQLQMERIRQEREQFEHIAGRTTGEVGFLKQELERLRASPAPQPIQDDLDYPAETPVQPQPQRAPSQLEGQVAELQESSRARAIEGVYSEFLSRVSRDLTAQGVEQAKLETEQNSIVEQITPTLKQRFESFGDVSTMNIKTTEKIARMVLEGAYTDTKLEKIAQLRKTNSERNATQIAANKIVKQAASPSGSGGRSVQESPPKSIEDMTWEEADAAMIAQYGDNGRFQKPRR